MKNFLQILLSAAKFSLFLAPVVVVGVLVALALGVPPGHLATVLAVPVLAVVLAFKIISALRAVPPQEAEAVRTELARSASTSRK